MRTGVVSAIFVVAAVVVYALLPGGTVALIGFEVLILIIAWMAIRRITATTAPDEDDEGGAGFVGWAFWRRHGPPGRPAPASLRRVEGLLRFSSRHAYTANERLAPLLRRLAAERLASGHGIDLDSQPERAAALLGPQAWAVVRTDRTQSPKHDGDLPSLGSLDATVTAIEAL